MYLQNATISDIVNLDGRILNQDFLKVTKPIKPKSTIRLSNQPLPSHQACKLWKKTIRNVFNISNHNILRNNQQLKEWIVPYSLRQISHRWNYSKVQNEIYELNQKNIYRYFIQHKEMLTYTLNLDSKELCTYIPPDTILVSAMEGNYFFLHQDLVISPPSLIKINSFKQYINTLPQWKRNLISNYEEHTTNSSLAETIQMKQKIMIASDGSKSKSTSGGAWIIANMKGNTFIAGTNPDFGHISQIHSHRADIYGVLSVLTFIKEYSNYFMIPFLSEIAYYYDNLEVVHKINTLANNPNYFNELHKTTDHDAVLQLKLYLPPNIITFYVKGQQDTRKKWEHLTIPERLNIQSN